MSKIREAFEKVSRSLVGNRCSGEHFGPFQEKFIRLLEEEMKQGTCDTCVFFRSGKYSYWCRVLHEDDSAPLMITRDFYCKSHSPKEEVVE